MSVQNCDAFLQNFSDAADLLSVAVCRKGEFVYSFQKKYLDRPEYGCFSEDTVYNIGSVTKIFIGALVLKGMEQGLFCMNTPVKSIVPEFGPGNVTIRHLLTHTSGYTRTNQEYHIDWPKSFAEMPEYWDSIYRVQEPERQPEEVVAYFSPGYSILMDLLERRTGKSIEELGQELLFKPLGMSHTTFDVRKIDKTNCIMPYNRIWEAFMDFWETPPVGDSGLFSNARDLLQFGKLLLDAAAGRGCRLFSPATFDFMFREITNNKFSKTPIFWIKTRQDSYACFADLCSPRAVCHPGFSGCILLVDPEYDFAYALVTNNASMDWNCYRMLGNVLFSELL